MLCLQGSESASSNYLQRKTSRGRRELIPLDELLNNSFEENLLTDAGSLEGSFDQHLLTEQLGVQKSRYVFCVQGFSQIKY